MQWHKQRWRVRYFSMMRLISHRFLRTFVPNSIRKYNFELSKGPLFTIYWSKIKETSLKSHWDFSKAKWTGDTGFKWRHSILTHHSLLGLRTATPQFNKTSRLQTEACADRQVYWTCSSQRLDCRAEYQHLMTLGLMKLLLLSEECCKAFKARCLDSTPLLQEVSKAECWQVVMIRAYRFIVKGNVNLIYDNFSVASQVLTHHPVSTLY